MKREKLPVRLDEYSDILDYKDISEILGINSNYACSLLRAEGFPSFQIGRQRKVYRSALIEWMEKGGSAKVPVSR